MPAYDLKSYIITTPKIKASTGMNLLCIKQKIMLSRLCPEIIEDGAYKCVSIHICLLSIGVEPYMVGDVDPIGNDGVRSWVN